jgi:hypothetical protein
MLCTYLEILFFCLCWELKLIFLGAGIHSQFVFQFTDGSVWMFGIRQIQRHNIGEGVSMLGCILGVKMPFWEKSLKLKTRPPKKL